MTAGILSSIHTPADVHALSAQQLRDLCLEIRATLLDYGKKHGGHIGSNLGVVELTVALHRVFDSPRDRFIFDVSHQSYVHKMLTGRAEAYLDQSRFDEVTGFTNPLESNMIPLCSAIPALRFLWPAVLPKPAICSAAPPAKALSAMLSPLSAMDPEFGHCVRGAEQCGRTGR